MLASKRLDPRRQSPEEIDRQLAARLDPAALGYWDGATHAHSFNLPKFIRRALDASTRVITDAHPLIVA
jgi:spermidine synthase